MTDARFAPFARPSSTSARRRLATGARWSMASRGQGRTDRSALALLALSFVLLSGCANDRLERALLADRTPAAHGHDLPSLYTVHCPDVLELHVATKPHWGGQQTVGPDGRITLPEAGPLRVD